MGRRFEVKGKRFIGVQGVPAVTVARAIRTGRGVPAGYGHGSWVARGWRMSVRATDASRERFRLAAISDL